METEFAIIGGGVVGLSVAYGLLLKGKRVIVLDEGDDAFRASRGNFGLVWVQSKGLTQPAYARWTRKSASAFRTFANELMRISQVNPALVQDGGYMISLREDEIDENRRLYENLRQKLDGDYPFEVLDHNALKAEEPHIGPKVAGALYCREDGHINPAKLLKSLAISVERLKGTRFTKTKVSAVEPQATGYRVKAENGLTITAEKVVLSAGLGAMDLGPALGFKAPITPNQGQVLITEKLPKLINRPSGEIRQVDEGGIQVGASHANVGMNDKVDINTVAWLAKKAVDIYPILKNAKLVRSWAALRIMSPDGLPIYQESPLHKGVFFVTCHSGITLAAAHANYLTEWLLNTPEAPDLSAFSEARF